MRRVCEGVGWQVDYGEWEKYLVGKKQDKGSKK